MKTYNEIFLSSTIVKPQDNLQNSNQKAECQAQTSNIKEWYKTCLLKPVNARENLQIAYLEYIDMNLQN